MIPTSAKLILSNSGRPHGQPSLVGRGSLDSLFSNFDSPLMVFHVPALPQTSTRGEIEALSQALDKINEVTPARF